MKKRDNLEFAYLKMRASETNEFIYSKWFLKNSFENFKKDVGECPGRNFIISKIDNNAAFSPYNFKWIKRPKIVQPNRKKAYIQKEVYDCITIQVHIAKGSDLSKAGIYKLTFSNGGFYIGSTKDFKIRMRCIACTFRGTSKLHNKSIIKCLAECDTAIFEVLEYMEDISLLKIRETEVIKENIANPLLLNRAHDAHSNKGVRWTDEERRKVKETLIEKYRTGQLSTLNRKPRTKRNNFFDVNVLDSRLFDSKLFGDKEKW